ncbi:MAG: glycine cleavage system aminomethyltransferase GcvT [Candidatus Margulisiibacteriota bacterium]
MLNRTPLYEKHLALGAKMVPFAGWEMPVQYPAGIIAEHLAVRSTAGLFDIGHMGLVKVEGDQALPLLQRAMTNDASRLAENQCQYTVLCNEAGGTIDDLFLYRLPMLYLIVANAVNADRVLARLKELSGNKHVAFYDNYCMLSVQGPQAVAVASKALAIPLAGLKHNRSLWWRDIILSRSGYTGEDGIELIAHKQEVPGLWDKFIKAGVQPCGLGARDTLRLEAGLPLYGHEYDEETSPLDAGYAWAVKFDKGDFIGKQALLKGPKKKLVGIEMAGRTIPRQGYPVLAAQGARQVGVVTSGTFSPTLKKPVALAYLTSDETAVLVDIRGQMAPGRVVDKAFYKRVQ